jgi:NAD(P)-dependent dehydrogenase (short-subunit alcohol dehydrogenase family)
MNEVALVTGAGRGIGRAIAVALAGTGVPVGLVARTGEELDQTAAEIAAAGGQSVSIVADLGSPDGPRHAVDRVRDTLGDVTLLVNNAGSNGVIGPTWEVDPEQWWHDVTVNLRGPFLCAREVLPAMVKSGHGRIINIVSGTATRSEPGQRWLGGLDDVAFSPADRVCDAILFLASGRGDALTGRCLFATDDLESLATRTDEIVRRDLYQLRLGRI